METGGKSNSSDFLESPLSEDDFLAGGSDDDLADGEPLVVDGGSKLSGLELAFFLLDDFFDFWLALFLDRDGSADADFRLDPSAVDPSDDLTDDDLTDGGLAAGGAAAGGLEIGGAVIGGAVIGGAATGGAATGGAVIGGATVSGAAVGGFEAGGFETGGLATGGLATGGGVVGGNKSPAHFEQDSDPSAETVSFEWHCLQSLVTGLVRMLSS